MSNRSVEYDTPDGTYGRFLLEEMLPEVARKYTLTDKPEERAICGSSSGGICAFKVAWERPDAFQKVVSHIGSFTNIRGGYLYPSLIRKTEAKAAEGAYTTPEQKNVLALRRKIRVFLQDGRNDLDNQFGNWPLANQEMAAALKFAGWDYEFVLGEGTHNGNHRASIFLDTMRWLWRSTKSLPPDTRGMRLYLSATLTLDTSARVLGADLPFGVLEAGGQRHAGGQRGQTARRGRGGGPVRDRGDLPRPPAA